jgi:hypothetical protein
MLATFAFDVCHDVYRAAREAIDSKIPTLNAEAAGKYQWRPDRLPRLAEYVCDFARAGEKALGGAGGADCRSSGFRAVAFGPILGEDRQGELGHSEHAWGRLARVDGNRQAEACPTGCRAGASQRARRASPPQNLLRASRMAMFRVYYLGGAEYQAARKHLGISELTWADWAEEIRRLTGRELTRAGLFPPSKYFREASVRAS